MFGGNDGNGYTDMMLLVRAFQLSKMLHVANTLELADRVADGPRPIAELANETGTHPDMLRRLCRALAAFGIFALDSDGRLGQSARSDWLRKDASPSLHYATGFWATPGSWQAWGALEDAVRTGRPASEITFGGSHFDYLQQHPAESAAFDAFMQHSPDDRHTAVVAAYDFSGATTVVDIAGGNGALLAAILAANPACRGVLVDQPNVVASVAEAMAARGLGNRCRVEAGDLFGPLPPGGDVYILSQIVHDWDDADCGTILRNCRAAIAEGGRLLIIERVLADDPAGTKLTDYLSDIEMMVLLPGRERSVEEFRELLAAAGFALSRVLPTRSPFSIVEARAT